MSSRLLQHAGSMLQFPQAAISAIPLDTTGCRSRSRVVRGAGGVQMGGLLHGRFESCRPAATPPPAFNSGGGKADRHNLSSIPRKV
eukprot:9423069-Pyramimonas_sp.AAC.1